jgi:hypothetical protein
VDTRRRMAWLVLGGVVLLVLGYVVVDLALQAVFVN